MYEMMYFRNCNFINLISDAFFSFSNFITYSSKSTFHSLCYTTSKNIQNIYKVMSFKFRIVLKFFSTIVLYSNSRFVLRKMLKNENIFYKNAKLFNLDAWDYIHTHTQILWQNEWQSGKDFWCDAFRPPLGTSSDFIINFPNIVKIINVLCFKNLCIVFLP